MSLSIIVKREYKERVAKKSFIITTILMPLFMVAMMVLPALITGWSTGDTQQVMVIDKSGRLSGALQDNELVKFTLSASPVDSALSHLEDEQMLLVIPEDIISANTSDLQLYTPQASSMKVEQAIKMQLNALVQEIRLQDMGQSDLERILAEVKPQLSINSVRTDLSSDRQQNTGLAFGIGMGMAFILYMFLMIYGQMIMTSIVEEKNNRVLELVVSSVKASTLMMGKIIGVSLVALTQILIWGVIILIVFLTCGDWLFQDDTLAMLGLSSGALSMLNFGYIAGLIGQMTLFLMVGFLFYASIYAAIGSAVDNIQDASQLQMFTVIPIVIGLIIAISVAAEPMTSMAVITSLIPFTAPMVMVSRLASDVPQWQVWTSLVIMIISFWAMVKITAKIYRVGIFMYGKKPSLKEILKWIRYK